MALMVRRPASTVIVMQQAEAGRQLEATPAPPAGQAAAAATTGPDVVWVIIAFALVIGGGFAAWGIYEWQKPSPFLPAAGISVFAPMYVIAQAIERLLEPFTSMLGGKPAEGDEEAKKKDEAKAKVEERLAANDLVSAVKWQAVVDRIKRNTTVIAWGVASCLAMLVSGWFGFRLLQGTGLDAPAGFDVVITGLAIGSGTKPLHDLISNLQKSKDQKANPLESATTL
jgi:hypothetical protein